LRVAYVDAGLDLLLPPLSVLAAADMVCCAGAGLLSLLRPSRVARADLVLAAGCSAVLAGHILSGLRAVGAPRSTYIALLGAPKLIAWKLALWVRVLARPQSVRWERTKRIGER
jgi:hypothetical protein